MKVRIPQLDYLKGIFILLMVTFHLALIEQTYPMLRNAVYTFHMSAFLIISGYLANVDKRPADFFHSLLRIFIPYVIFESVYLLAQYYIGGDLGAHNAIQNLSPTLFITMITTQPSGPYWYLHTMIICVAVYWLVYRIIKLDGISGLAVMGLVLFGLSVVIEGLDWSNAIYFMIGVFIFRSGKSFMSVITPSMLALLPLILLFWFPENYHRGTLAGIAITILVISLLLAIFPYCGRIIQNSLAYIGRNSLAIVVFSPIFTLATKKISSFFAFEPTAICFTAIALAFVVACCLFSAWLSDKLSLSRFIFLKNNFYSHYKP